MKRVPVVVSVALVGAVGAYAGVAGVTVHRLSADLQQSERSMAAARDRDGFVRAARAVLSIRERASREAPIAFEAPYRSLFADADRAASAIPASAADRIRSWTEAASGSFDEPDPEQAFLRARAVRDVSDGARALRRELQRLASFRMEWRPLDKAEHEAAHGARALVAEGLDASIARLREVRERAWDSIGAEGSIRPGITPQDVRTATRGLRQAQAVCQSLSVDADKAARSAGIPGNYSRKLRRLRCEATLAQRQARSLEAACEAADALALRALPRAEKAIARIGNIPHVEYCAKASTLRYAASKAAEADAAARATVVYLRRIPRMACAYQTSLIEELTTPARDAAESLADEAGSTATRLMHDWHAAQAQEDSGSFGRFIRWAGRTIGHVWEWLQDRLFAMLDLGNSALCLLKRLFEAA